MFRIGHGVEQVGEHRCPEESHHAAHGGAGGDKGPARTVPVDEYPDGRDGNDRQGGDSVNPGGAFQGGRYVRHAQQGGRPVQDDQDGEDDDAGSEQFSDLFLQASLGFHQQVNSPVHGEQGDRRQPQKNGIRIQQAEKCSGEVAMVVQRNAFGDVSHGYADEQSCQKAADGEGGIPSPAPPFHGLFASEFNGHGAEDKGEQQEHEGQVKPGEDGGVYVRKGSEEGSSARDEPDFVSVPYRAHGI